MRPVVLLVHRSARQRELFREALEQGGLEAYAVPDGRAALASFPDIEPEIVVLDAVNPMPAIPQFCKELRSLAGRREVPVLVTNDLHRGADYHRQVLALGATAVLERGFSEDDLVRSVWEIVEGSGAKNGSGTGLISAWEELDARARREPEEPDAPAPAAGPRPGEDDFVFEAAPAPNGRGRDGVRFFGKDSAVQAAAPTRSPRAATRAGRPWMARAFGRPVQIAALALLVAVGWWIGRQTAWKAPVSTGPISEASIADSSRASRAPERAPVEPASAPAAEPASTPSAPSASTSLGSDDAARANVAQASRDRATTGSLPEPGLPERGAAAASAQPKGSSGASAASGPAHAPAPASTKSAPGPAASGAAPAGGAPEGASGSARETGRAGVSAVDPIRNAPERASETRGQAAIRSASPPAAAATATPAAAPADAASSSTDPLRPDVPATPLSRPVPAYPPLARQQHVHGEVLLQTLVLDDGKVGEVRVLRSPSPLLANAAEQAVRKWRYHPASKAGRPVASWRIEAIAFEE